MSMIRLPHPFAASGNWYRGCLHVHTTESDGAMSPEALVRHYQMGGYDFVAITDHDRLTDRTHLSSPDFLVLRGIEVQVGRAELGERYHVVGIGISEPVDPRHWESAQATIDAIREAGGEAIVAHPYWSGLTVSDLLALRDYLAIEVYNTGCEVGNGRGHGECWWDEMLTRGRPTLAVAADDSHWPGFDSLGAWVMVKAPALTAEAMMAALRAGSFYCSNGPQIESLSWDEGAHRVEVHCSPVGVVALIADPTLGSCLGAGRFGIERHARHVWGDRPWAEGLVDGAPITGAVLDLQGKETYTRVQVTDFYGRRAWANPLFVSQPD